MNAISTWSQIRVLRFKIIAALIQGGWASSNAELSPGFAPSIKLSARSGNSGADPAAAEARRARRGQGDIGVEPTRETVASADPAVPAAAEPAEGTVPLPH